MPRYTRGELQNIVKNDSQVLNVLEVKGGILPSAINSLMSDLVAKGLSYREDKPSFHSSGRSEHTYGPNELMGYLGGYLAAVSRHNTSLKKCVATSIVTHFKELGHSGVSRTCEISRVKALRTFIFGQVKSDEYYALA